MKSTRSDLSFRATLRPLSTAPPPTDNTPRDARPEGGQSNTASEARLSTLEQGLAKIPIPRGGEEPSAVISRLVEQATDLADWG